MGIQKKRPVGNDFYQLKEFGDKRWGNKTPLTKGISYTNVGSLVPGSLGNGGDGVVTSICQTGQIPLTGDISFTGGGIITLAQSATPPYVITFTGTVPKTDLLDGNYHKDTDTTHCTTGGLIYGSHAATPLWTVLLAPVAGKVLTSKTDGDAVIPSWEDPVGGLADGTVEGQIPIWDNTDDKWVYTVGNTVFMDLSTKQTVGGEKIYTYGNTFNETPFFLKGLNLKSDIIFANSTNAKLFHLQAGITADDCSFTLPLDYPAKSGYALVSTDAGVMSWADASGGAGLYVGLTGDETVKGKKTWFDEAIFSDIVYINSSLELKSNSFSITFYNSFDAEAGSIMMSDTHQLSFNMLDGNICFNAYTGDYNFNTYKHGGLYKFYAETSGGTGYTLTLPNSAPASTGQVLVDTDGKGTLGWDDAGGESTENVLTHSYRFHIPTVLDPSTEDGTCLPKSGFDGLYFDSEKTVKYSSAPLPLKPDVPRNAVFYFNNVERYVSAAFDISLIGKDCNGDSITDTVTVSLSANEKGKAATFKYAFTSITSISITSAGAMKIDMWGYWGSKAGVPNYPFDSTSSLIFSCKTDGENPITEGGTFDEDYGTIDLTSIVVDDRWMFIIREEV